jgi:hypothetical protein
VLSAANTRSSTALFEGFQVSPAGLPDKSSVKTVLCLCSVDRMILTAKDWSARKKPAPVTLVYL